LGQSKEAFIIPEEVKRKFDILLEKFQMLGYSDSLVFLEQFSYLMLVKLINDMHDSEQKYLLEIMKEFDDYDYDKINWTSISKLDEKELTLYLKQNVFPCINKIGRTVGSSFEFMENASLVINKYDILVGMIDLIDIIFSKEKRGGVTNSEISGQIIEYLLGISFDLQSHGEFFTPTHLVEVMVQMLSPEPECRLFDPSCGSGSFLIASRRYIENKYGETAEIYLTGSDVNLRVLNIAKMNLFFNGIYTADLELKDSLRDVHKNNLLYDLILANPPVGVNYSISEEYPFFDIRTRNINLLFIQIIMEKLDVNGKCAVLIPEGFLFRGGVDYIAIREKLLNEFIIEGIVSLPLGVFMPYTNAKASILFFTKRGSCLSKNHIDKVWFYELTADGYSLDRKRIPVSKNDIPDLLEKWRNREKDLLQWKEIIQEGKTVYNESGIASPIGWEKNNVWFADYDCIKSKDFNLSASIYKPPTTAKIQYNSPQELLSEILYIEEEMIEKLKNLMKETEIYG